MALEQVMDWVAVKTKKLLFVAANRVSVVQEHESCALSLLEQELAANLPPSEPEQKKCGRQPQSPTKHLIDRVQRHQAEVLVFLYDLNGLFDKKQDELDLRMTKVKQKIAGCFRLQTGANAFCQSCGCLSTARKNGQRLLDSLHLALSGPFFVPVCISDRALPAA